MINNCLIHLFLKFKTSHIYDFSLVREAYSSLLFFLLRGAVVGKESDTEAYGQQLLLGAIAVVIHFYFVITLRGFLEHKLLRTIATCNILAYDTT